MTAQFSGLLPRTAFAWRGFVTASGAGRAILTLRPLK
jgi:hypothetical protein